MSSSSLWMCLDLQSVKSLCSAAGSGEAYEAGWGPGLLSNCLPFASTAPGATAFSAHASHCSLTSTLGPHSPGTQLSISKADEQG
jgi:hypothetical protein